MGEEDRRPGLPRPLYTPNGPRHQTCRICYVRISTNALARGSHERGRQHQENLGKYKGGPTK
jgi:hypothetical protein